MKRAGSSILIVIIVNADVTLALFAFLELYVNWRVMDALAQALDAFRTPDAVIHSHRAETDLVETSGTGSRFRRILRAKIARWARPFCRC